MVSLVVLAASATFGAAAWLGVLLSDALYSRYVPFDDGPKSTKVSWWIFVLAGMVLGAGVALHGASSAQLVVLGLATAALAACTATDFACGLVPDVFTLVPLAGILVWYGLHGDYGPAFSGLVVAVPFALMAAFTKGRGMGWGDVKLAALGGALLGARGALIAFIVACIGVLVFSRLFGDRKRPIAFAPYLASGIGAVLVIGSTI